MFLVNVAVFNKCELENECRECKGGLFSIVVLFLKMGHL